MRASRTTSDGRSGRSPLDWDLASLGIALLALLSTGDVTASADDPFPEIRPASRAQAVDYLLPRQVGNACAVPDVQALHVAGAVVSDRSAARARALSLLSAPIAFDDETLVVGPGGFQVRYASGANDFDRLDATDRDDDGTPDRLHAIFQGLEQARAVLVGSLELPAPEHLDVVLANLRMGLHGYVVPAPSPAAPLTLVLDSGPGGNLDVVRRAAIQAYAQAVALTVDPNFPAGWSDALALWTTLNVDGVADSSTASCLSNRIARLSEGLLADDRDLAAGNALWLAFLEQAYDLAAVRSTVEELAGGGSIASALERATGDELPTALREFHVWTVLVGDRADEHHFSFADRLQSPSFASTAQGTPALSVQSDPAVGPYGTTQIALRPDHKAGGLRILFEGDFNANWEADLILLGRDGTKRRLALALAEGRGEATVPNSGLSEVWLLIRNVGAPDATPRRYSYSAHHEKGFPFELGRLEATPVEDGGVLVAWDTDAEFHLFGFNIVRRRESGGQSVIVNPIWIPALGDPAESTAYRYVDRSGEPGVAYDYSIQGITRDGLTSQSDPVNLQPLPTDSPRRSRSE